MPPTTRKKINITPSLPSIVSSPPQNGVKKGKYKDDDPFERVFNSVDDLPSDHDSDFSDYAQKKRKRMTKADMEKAKRRRTGVRHGPPPAVPDLSDDESTTIDERDEPHNRLLSIRSRRDSNEPESNRASKEAPTILCLQIEGKSGEKTVINLDLANLLKTKATTASVRVPHTPESLEVPDADAEPELDEETLVETKGKGFFNLPYELRVRIYRMVFHGGTVLNFELRENLSRSSAFLRTCKTVYEEGRKILYGENSFHFGRDTDTRGKMWEREWEQIGFKDIRRFFETIGAVNISHMKYVSFNMFDYYQEKGQRGLVPEKIAHDRKFVNDPNLHQIFRIIGANTTLDTLAVIFAGRAMVSHSDFHFLKAISDVKCYNFHVIDYFRRRSHRCASNVCENLAEVMVVRDPDSPDKKKRKQKKKQKKQKQTIKMVYDEDRTCGTIIKF